MPLYEYKCLACCSLLEVLQKVNEPRLKKCPKCGGLLKKVFSPPAIQFKCSGWYINYYAQYKKQEKVRISIWLILPRAVLSFKAPLLLVASTTDLLGLWLFGYAVYNLVSLVGMVLLSLRRAKFEDR